MRKIILSGLGLCVYMALGFLYLLQSFSVLFCFIQKPLHLIQPTLIDAEIFLLNVAHLLSFIIAPMHMSAEWHSQIFEDARELHSLFLVNKKPHTIHYSSLCVFHRVAYVEAKTTSLCCQKVNCFPAVILAQFFPSNRCLNIFQDPYYKSEPVCCKTEPTNPRSKFLKLKKERLMELNPSNLRFSER